MFIRGHAGMTALLDNTTDEEIDAWIKALQVIRPKQVMIYTFERERRRPKVCKKSPWQKLNEIAEKVRTITALIVAVFA